MSKTITHDGVEYIAKDHVDEIVRQRIAKYSEKLTTTESKLSEYQSRLDEASAKIGLVDNLTSQVESLRGELTTANSRYDRHTVISQYGITDGGVRDAVEWAYEREMQGRTKKDRQPLSDWMQAIHDSPESAPAVLRPFINAPQVGDAETAAPQIPPAQQTLQQQTLQQYQQHQQQNTPAPTSNRGVAAGTGAPVPNDILKRATDPAFYAQNRDAIRQAFYSQSGKTDSPFKF
jgi:hypothetical protein